ncbi:MAG: ATP-dependent helicase HrpB [Acidobacteriota bacterium]
MSPAPLPIDDVVPALTDALREHAAIVLRAPTGAGKTTRVPPAILDAGLAPNGKVMMLEPRRIAARAAARRMASERKSKLGEEIGFQIRFERRHGARTRILVVTEGVLVQRLQSDPFLDGIDVVVFDEFHERNLDTDLALAMTRRVQLDARPDLKIVVMSATLEPGPIAAWLGDCPVIDSRGRLFPVAISHLERTRPGEPIEPVAARGVREVLASCRGDVLVFLPGVGEIRRTADLLGSTADSQNLSVLQLYGDLDSAAQDRVLRPGDRRKVVLATNVAETSITIDGIEAVVDSGLARQLRFDPASGLDRLDTVRISRASADQRSGRAGRQGPGQCLRLWTMHDDRTLRDRDEPEVRRIDLTGPTLQLLAWGEPDIRRFSWFEAPSDEHITRALDLLGTLEAVDSRGITPLGRDMARLPLHPRLARLMVASWRRGAGERGALLAALAAERDPVHRPTGSRPVQARIDTHSDLLDRLYALEDLAAGGRGETALGPLHHGRARFILATANDIARQARRAFGDPAPETGDSDDVLRHALWLAFPDRVARRRAADSRRALMTGGRGVRLAEMSSVRSASLFLCLELDDRGSEALVRRASAVNEAWLDTHTRDEVVFDSASEKVLGLRRRYYEDLVLEEKSFQPDRAALEEALTTAASQDPTAALALERPDVAAFLARLRSLRHWCPELMLPTFDDEELRPFLPLLASGCRGLADLRQRPLVSILEGTLTNTQRRALEKDAPERIEVPSGSRIRLDYRPGEPPILAVRIQELFGLADTPRVAAGKVTVLLHLLAPNMRPQQVTRDLASFWRNTYPEVRKELAGRYPKHAWPDDPLTAEPERRPRRRK